MIPGIKLPRNTLGYENPQGLRLIESSQLNRGDIVFPLARQKMALPGQRSVDAVMCFVICTPESQAEEGLTCFILAADLTLSEDKNQLQLVVNN